MDKDKKKEQEKSEFEKHHIEENGLMNARKTWRLLKETSNDKELVEFNNTELAHIKKQQFQKNRKTGKFENYYGRTVDTFEEANKHNSDIRKSARKILQDENKVNQFLYFKVNTIDEEGKFESILTKLQTNKPKPTQTKPVENKDAEFVIPYSQPLMTADERQKLEMEIQEMKFNELLRPKPDPDLTKGLGSLLVTKTNHYQPNRKDEEDDKTNQDKGD